MPPAPRSTLLGREEELALLRSVVELADGTPRCVVLLGDPGAGRSALLAATRETAAAAGALVLFLRGVDAEQDLPFAGLQLLLEPLLPRRRQLPAVQRAALETAVGLAGGGTPSMLLVGVAALGVLSDAAVHQDVVIVVDDLSSVDASSQVALAFVARRIGEQRIALVASARSAYDGALTEAAHLVGLGSLTAEESFELVRRALPALDRRTRDRVLAGARGNPLALVELPLAMASAAPSPVWRLPSTLPLTPRLTQAFGGRLTSLPLPTRDALLVAATYQGSEVGPVLAAASLVSDAPATLADLQPAAEASLVDVSVTAVHFRHPLVRSAVLDGETASRRQGAHAALAVALRHDRLGRAWHRAAATLDDDDDLADELESVAPLASTRGRVAQAVRCWERSAELTGDPRRRGRRFLAAAVASLGVGDSDGTAALLARANALPLSGTDRRRLGWAHEVLDPDEPTDPQRVERLCDLAGEATRLDDPGLAHELLLSAALRCWWSHPPAATWPAVRRAVLALPDTGDSRHPMLLGIVRQLSGDSPGAAEVLDRAEAGLRGTGEDGRLAQVLLAQIGIRLSTGDWSRAETAIEEVRRLREGGADQVWDTALLVARARSAGLRGQLPEALELAGRAELAATGQRVSTLLTGVQLARGCAWAGVGRFTEAYVELRRLVRGQDPGCLDRAYPAIMLLAEAATHSGHRLEARELVDEWSGRAAGSPDPDLLVHLRYAQAVLAEDDTAGQLYETALAGDLDRWPFVRAMLQAAYGGWLRRQRRIIESRRLIRPALLTFDLIGARGWAARARSELAAAGERQETPARPLAEVLSPQQREIAELAAGGLSNREIGERLFLSPRTVGSHLYRIFPKLGVTSRIQLVHRLQESASGALQTSS